MKKSTMIIIGVVVLLLIWIVGSYNGLVRADKGVDNQWAQVENQFQRRLDLIPNLVNTVKGSTQQELAVVQEITEARAAYTGANNVDDRAAAASRVETGLGRLIAIGEANPAISTVPAFQDLMAQLEGTENRVSVERGRYNEAVTNMNIKVKTFPGNIVAGIFGFDERTLFEAEEGADQAPEVNF